MILVTLGTQDKTFPRLIEAVEKQIELGNIKEEVIVQAGSTKYESDKMKILDFIPLDEFNEIYKKASLIITHAGESNIIMGLEQGKKVIAAARLAKYGEHVNDHQLQILEGFANEDYILPLYDFDKLDEVLEKAKTFKVKEYKSNTENFLKQLENEVGKLL